MGVGTGGILTMEDSRRVDELTALVNCEVISSPEAEDNLIARLKELHCLAALEGKKLSVWKYNPKEWDQCMPREHFLGKTEYSGEVIRAVFPTNGGAKIILSGSGILDLKNRNADYDYTNELVVRVGE